MQWLWWEIVISPITPPIHERQLSAKTQHDHLALGAQDGAYLTGDSGKESRVPESYAALPVQNGWAARR